MASLLQTLLFLAQVLVLVQSFPLPAALPKLKGNPSEQSVLETLRGVNLDILEKLMEKHISKSDPLPKTHVTDLAGRLVHVNNANDRKTAGKQDSSLWSHLSSKTNALTIPNRHNLTSGSGTATAKGMSDTFLPHTTENEAGNKIGKYKDRKIVLDANNKKVKVSKGKGGEDHSIVSAEQLKKLDDILKLIFFDSTPNENHRSQSHDNTHSSSDGVIRNLGMLGHQVSPEEKAGFQEFLHEEREAPPKFWLGVEKEPQEKVHEPSTISSEKDSFVDGFLEGAKFGEFMEHSAEAKHPAHAQRQEETTHHSYEPIAGFSDGFGGSHFGGDFGGFELPEPNHETVPDHMGSEGSDFGSFALPGEAPATSEGDYFGSMDGFGGFSLGGAFTEDKVIISNV